MATAPETAPPDLEERLARLEAQMRKVNAALEAISEVVAIRAADEQIAALAAERIRSGAAMRTEDGAQALAELGITAG